MADEASALRARWQRMTEVTRVLHGAGDLNLTLANATIYLEAFGHVVVGWLWLRQAAIADAMMQRGASDADMAFYRGKIHTALYFAQWELAQISTACRLLVGINTVPYEMRDSWF